MKRLLLFCFVVGLSNIPLDASFGNWAGQKSNTSGWVPEWLGGGLTAEKKTPESGDLSRFEQQRLDLNAAAPASAPVAAPKTLRVSPRRSIGSDVSVSSSSDSDSDESTTPALVNHRTAGKKSASVIRRTKGELSEIAPGVFSKFGPESLSKEAEPVLAALATNVAAAKSSFLSDLLYGSPATQLKKKYNLSDSFMADVLKNYPNFASYSDLEQKRIIKFITKENELLVESKHLDDILHQQSQAAFSEVSKLIQNFEMKNKQLLQATNLSLQEEHQISAHNTQSINYFHREQGKLFEFVLKGLAKNNVIKRDMAEQISKMNFEFSRSDIGTETAEMATQATPEVRGFATQAGNEAIVKTSVGSAQTEDVLEPARRQRTTTGVQPYKEHELEREYASQSPYTRRMMQPAFQSTGKRPQGPTAARLLEADLDELRRRLAGEEDWVSSSL